MEEAPPIEVAEDPAAGSLPGLVTLSAKSAEALIMRAKQLLNWLNENPDAGLGDVCYTTNVSRSQFSFRFAAPAGSAEELKGRLASWLQAAGDNSLRLETSERPRTAFMFSGQGSQYVGMAQQLYQTHPVFREAMDRCDALARPQLERSLLDIIFARDGDETLVNRTDYTQPAVFAVEYALTELLGSWGIAPDAVIGHSLGEIAAACAAKVIGLEDAMLLATARGSLMHGLPAGGAMVSIMASQNVIRPLIDEIAPEIAVAAMNGPLNTVVSGDRDALKLLTAALDRQGLTHRELHISNGFHSCRTDPILDEMEKVAGRIKYSAPEIPLISNLTGEAIVSAIDKTYWRRHIREAVRFGDGMLALDKLECQNFIEVGPHAVLLPMAQACLQSIGKSPTWIATLKRNTSDANSISEMLASLYLAGHTINWTAVHAGSKWRRIPLPTYPFQRKRHWIESNSLDRPRIQSVNQASHPLIGRRFDSGSDGLRFEARYGIRHIPYLSDHRVSGTVVLPTTVELEAATAAGRIYFGTSRISFDGAMHHQAISLADGEERLVRLSVDPLSNGKASLKIASASTQHADVWNIHMTGTIRKSELPPSSTFTMRDVRTRCRQTMPSAALYELLAKGGLEYGPCFRGVREVHLGQDEALTKVQLPDGLGSPEYINHPAFLDACLHAYPLVIPTNSEGAESEQSFYLPVALGGFRSFQDGIEQAWVHTRLRSVEKDGTQLIDIHAYDDSGRLVAELEGLAVRRLPFSKVRQPQASNDNLYYRIDWRQSDRAHAILEKRRTPASWLIFADTKGVATTLASRLEAEGHHCHLVYRGDAMAQQGPHTWTVSEREPRDFQLLLTQFSRLETLPCEGVIYMWGLDAPSIDGLTLEGLKSGSEIMCRGALAALHSLVETRSASSGRRLWFVTANTQHFGHAGRDLDPVQAPLWGLGRTIAIEYPSVWGGLIDLQLDDAGPNFNGLKSELLHPDGENQIAISTRGERYIPRLVKQLLSDLPHKPLMVHGDAAYLVTGGLGMLGRSVTKWLVSKGARHIVLTGRNAHPEEAHQIFNPAELNGASIHIVPADVSREEDVERLIQWVRQE
ncbi:MAG: SDR family NAD(P)-dependent oxidoreductase, partial [Tardiphaga sp.]